jgi:hypothetical protein
VFRSGDYSPTTFPATGTLILELEQEYYAATVDTSIGGAGIFLGAYLIQFYYESAIQHPKN